MTAFDKIFPDVGRYDYIIPFGDFTLINEGKIDHEFGFPFELSMYRGREPLNINFRADRSSSDEIKISILAALPSHDLSEGLSIFIRALLRRIPERSGHIFWEERFPLLSTDAFVGKLVQKSGFYHLNIVAADLLPRKQVDDLGQVYNMPEDIPWNFRPLDYDIVSLALQGTDDLMTILDIGVGAGRNAVAIENCGHTLHGIDISDASIRSCHGIVRYKQNYLVSSVLDLPYEGHKFDMVLDIGCLHMLSNKEERLQAISEVARVLGDKGRLFSRMFKPRSEAWLKAQPFVSSRLGIDPNEATEEMSHYLMPEIIKETEDIIYLKASKHGS